MQESETARLLASASLNRVRRRHLQRYHGLRHHGSQSSRLADKAGDGINRAPVSSDSITVNGLPSSARSSAVRTTRLPRGRLWDDHRRPHMIKPSSMPKSIVWPCRSDPRRARRRHRVDPLTSVSIPDSHHLVRPAPTIRMSTIPNGRGLVSRSSPPLCQWFHPRPPVALRPSDDRVDPVARDGHDAPREIRWRFCRSGRSWPRPNHSTVALADDCSGSPTDRPQPADIRRRRGDHTRAQSSGSELFTGSSPASGESDAGPARQRPI